MTDPEETPAQEIERLRREISQLRALRADLPRLILEPYVESAKTHIGEVAARLTVSPTVPAGEAIAGAREAEQAASQPAGPPEFPPGLPILGTRVYSREAQARAIVLAGIPLGRMASPEQWGVLILTEDGRILVVPPEDLSPEATGIPTGVPTPAPKIAPGQHVKDKATGKTGFVSEVAEDKAIVALDEGGFLTRTLGDLEPI